MQLSAEKVSASLFKSLIARLVDSDLRAFPLMAFVIPLLVRGLPEILMGGFLTGFDTVSYYVPVCFKWASDGAGIFEALAYAPLLYGLLVVFMRFGVPLIVALKVVGPVLHGLLGLSIFAFARRALAWSDRKSLAVSLLACLYFVSLRISWDMLRSELGLVFLFVSLMFLGRDLGKNAWKHFGLALTSMILAVLSHQLVAVILFAVVCAMFVQKLVRRESVAARNLAVCTLPAVALFTLMVCSSFAFSGDFSLFGYAPKVESGGWFSLFGFSSYFDMVVKDFGFFVYCYWILLPFVFVGIRALKRLELKAWSLWGAFAFVLPLVSPIAFSVASYRWILLLVFPMAFFAVEGFARIRRRILRMALVGALILLSVGFVMCPAESALPYFGAYPNYVPSSMLQNSVPLCDCEDVARALEWTKNSMKSQEVLLCHDAFHGWALQYLDAGQVVCYGYRDPEQAASSTAEMTLGRLLLIWWIDGEGWHGVETLPSSFVEVYRSGRMAVYEYARS